MQQDYEDISQEQIKDKADSSFKIEDDKLIPSLDLSKDLILNEDVGAGNEIPQAQLISVEDLLNNTESTSQLFNNGAFQFQKNSNNDVSRIDDGSMMRDDPEAQEDQAFFEELIVHNAKKNLCFELEYIQTVFQSINIRASTQFDLFRTQLKEEVGANQAMEKMEQRKAGQEETKRGIINFVDQDQTREKDMKTFLENIYNLLLQTKRDFLKQDIPQSSKKATRKALKAMASYLERTRWYLDGYIYPRDIALNLMDVFIEPSQQHRRKEMHLTERLYTIVYKDFFTAYEKCVQLSQKIKQMEGVDVEKVNQRIQSDSRISVALQNDLENLSEDSSFIETQTIVSENKTTRDVDELRKNFIRNTLGSRREGLFKILKSFSPTLATQANIEMEEILDREFALILSIKHVNITNHELFFTMYGENNQPYSLTSQLDTSRILTWQKAEYVFVNISLRALLSQNLAIIINVIEKRKSKAQSLTYSLLKTNEEFDTHKVYKGYAILPITKMFWAQQLRHKQTLEIKEAMCYKQSNSFKIEEKYATLIDKRGFKKYRDPNLAKFINLCFSYKMESKIDELQLMRSSSILVNRINFDQRDFSQKGRDQIRMYKSKEKYRFNDIKVDLKSIAFFESNPKKSPIIRIQVALRDNYGVVYDTVYKCMCDNQFEFTQTYESLIYQNQDDIAMHESFFVRIPTKSLDTLKKLYLIFLVQTLVTNKDSKGAKIKSSNYTNELERLQFKTEIFGILRLYDDKNKSILKNQTFPIAMWQYDEQLFKELVKFDQSWNFKMTDDRLAVQIRIISNEFTHNHFINNLMLQQEKNTTSQEYEKVITELKKSDPDEMIIYHDKILDKLFQIMNFTKSIKIQDMVFETIIEIIQLFQIEYKDYKEYLNLYIEKHFAHSKVYIPLLHQIRQTSEIIKEGFRTETEIQKEDVILASIKYLSVVLKIMKISFKEELSCQDSLPHNQEPHQHLMSEIETQDYQKGNTTVEPNQFYQQSLMKLDLYKRLKRSMIEEDDEDEESDDNEENQKITGALDYLNQKYDPENDRTDSKMSLMRKKAIRNTIQHEGILNKHELSKREFGIYVQKSMISIFEGCHKDAMKSTLSIRAILYENITDIFDQIIDFMDDKFLSQILMFLYEEQPYQYKVSKFGLNNHRNTRNQNQHRTISQIQSDNNNSHTSRGLNASSQAVGGGQKKMLNRGSEIIEDYVTRQNFISGLKDLNFINEEYITKLKIVAMGKILANGLLDQVQGNSNRIVKAFCDNVQQYHLKREELNLHVFYFLYQLFVYLKDSDDQTYLEFQTKMTPQKLKIFSKTSLDLKDFFAKILPQITQFLWQLYKQPNINYKLKEIKDLEDTLNPFKEKSALVLLSVANAVTKEKIKEHIFPDHKKLTIMMINLKKLCKKMYFQEPYSTFFEKKKIQVIRKLNEYVIQIFMEMNENEISQEYQAVLTQCRNIQVFLWCKLASLKMEFKKTIRSKTLVKDQLKAHKGNMLQVLRQFCQKFRSFGQPWQNLRYMCKDMVHFLILGAEKGIRIYMEIVSDTIQLEYENTQDIIQTSQNIFEVFNELNMKGSEDLCKKFYQAFDQEVCNTKLYANQQKFQRFVDLRLKQMRKLQEALLNVNYSNAYMQTNIFYRVFCQAKLMEVFWELNLFHLYSASKEKFKRLHEKLNNFAEIAYTDLRQIEILSRLDESQVQIGSNDIKALIQIDILKLIKDNLKKAELYEKAIEICGEMKDLYENVIFNYEQVSKTLKEQASLYQEISVNQNRHYATYFKLGFFGQSYPGMLKNQEFIYRGGKLVRRSDVISKLQEQFPDAIPSHDLTYPSSDILNGAKKYIQITPVYPLTYKEMQQFNITTDPEELTLGKKVKALPERLRSYYTQNFKKRFYRETVIPSKHTDDLQKDIQIEIFKVKDKFPTIINMQNIVKTKKIIQKGIDKAIRDVKDHIERIENAKKTVQNQTATQIQPTREDSEIDALQSLIRSTLESPIQGGIQRYLNAFLNEDYLNSPNDRQKVLSLFKMMEDCSSVINDAIQLLQQKSQNEIMQTKMSGDFLKFKEQMVDIRAYIDQSIHQRRV